MFKVKHNNLIVRERNCYADKLAIIGLTTNYLVWMNDIPIQARANFIRNRLGLLCNRFVNSYRFRSMSPFHLVLFVSFLIYS